MQDTLDTTTNETAPAAEMQVVKFQLAGTAGTLDITVPTGGDVAAVLVAGIKILRLAPEIIDRLSVVVDTNTVAPSDPLPADARVVSATGRHSNG